MLKLDSLTKHHKHNRQITGHLPQLFEDITKLLKDYGFTTHDCEPVIEKTIPFPPLFEEETQSLLIRSKTEAKAQDEPQCASSSKSIGKVTGQAEER